MSSPENGLAQEGDPYQAVVELVRRRHEETPEPSAEEADAAFRELVDLTLRLFADYARQHGDPPLPEPHALTATDAAMVSTHLLRAVDIALFELAMWQSWSGTGDVGTMRLDPGHAKAAQQESPNG